MRTRDSMGCHNRGRARARTVLAVGLFVWLSPGAVSAGTCETRKSRTLAKAVVRSLKCNAKEEANPAFDFSACERIIVPKCERSMTAAQTASCLASGVGQAACDNAEAAGLDLFNSYASTGSPYTCALKRGKPLGKNVAAYLKCIAKDLRDGVLDHSDADEACIGAAETKCEAAFDKAQDADVCAGATIFDPSVACKGAADEADTLAHDWIE